MRSNITAMNKSLQIAMLAMLALLITSCGAYQNDLDDTDGIYVSRSATNQFVPQEDPSMNSSYYRQYFQSKEGDFANLPEEGAIFTDIESYSTTERMDDDGYIIIEEPQYSNGNGAWGTNTTDVTVNVFGGAGWGWGWIVRLVLIVVFLLMAVPIASHALAFAAVREKKR